jgi:hypothetical protein
LVISAIIEKLANEKQSPNMRKFAESGRPAAKQT